MATIRNILIDQGSTFSISIQLTDSDKNPFDLTGYDARSQMRKSYGSITKVEFTTSTGIDPTLGEITISLTDTQTSTLRAGRYVYDVEILTEVQSGLSVTRVLEGIITVTPEVTRYDD